MYQHHDEGLLTPVIEEAIRRGHTVIYRESGLEAFAMGIGKRALISAAEFLHYEHAEGMRATNICRQHGIPSFGLQHGFPSGFHDADQPKGLSTSDHYLVWGDYWHNWFDSQHIVTTGNPAFDNLPAPSPPDEKFALMCPQLMDWPHNRFLHNRTPDERAEEFIKLAERIDYDYDWFVRPHPSDWKYPNRIDLHRYIADQIGGELQERGVPLFDTLKYTEVCAGMSTVLLEAMLFGSKAYPIGVDYLPEPLTLTDELVTNIGGASATVMDFIEQKVDEIYNTV